MADRSSAVEHIPQTRPPDVDISVPHSARIWNYWLGGKDNYPADRAVGEKVLKVFPQMAETARADRAFLVRAVTCVAGDEGVRQFLDIGTGLPTANNTHEVAQSVAPECRVVYVDNDPLVLAHARALLVGTPEGATDYVDADLRDPETILEAAARTLDLTRPVGLTLLGILGHITDHDEAHAIVRRLTEALPSGSYLVISDAVRTPEMERAIQVWNASGPAPYRSRTPEQLTRFFDGFELLEPGVVPTPRWRPRPDEAGNQPKVDTLSGVGRKP